MSQILVDIGKHEFTLLWEGVYYFALSSYPEISDWELWKLLCFIRYEAENGRTTQWRCDDSHIARRVQYALDHPEAYAEVPRPEKLTECTACRQGGCMTDFLCHTASPENALSIFRDGALLSAVEARGMAGEALARETRNAARDPADYFEYVMFSWGNCQAGDRLVMERKLGHDPTPEELNDRFEPGVRFIYRFETLAGRENAVFDGYHPLKLRRGLPLARDIWAVIIPKRYRDELDAAIPAKLRDKVHDLESRGLGLWEWSDRVYQYIKAL